MLVFVSVQNEHFHTILHNQFLPPANEVCKGYVFTPVCQSFCSQGGEYLSRYTPGQVHPPGRYTPLGRYTPQAGTPPRQCMLGYGQQAGGTHPTGMHSCLSVYLPVLVSGSVNTPLQFIHFIKHLLNFDSVKIWLIFPKTL